MPYVKMTRVAERIMTAKAAVYFWAAQKIKKIVIADATDSILLKSNELSVFTDMGIAVEQLCYQQNEQLIKQKGKGYGEGELISVALKNSVLLREHESFFKCTGKYCCQNFSDIAEMIKQHNFSNIFWRYYRSDLCFGPWTDTRFFYTTKDFAVHYLIPAYLKTDEQNGIMCELPVYNVLNDTMASAIMLKPKLHGFAGASGELQVDASLGVLDVHYPCWMSYQEKGS